MKKPETYAEYLKRVSGFADFTPLTLEKWEKDTNQGTASLPSLSTKYPAKLHTPVLNITAQFIPAQQPPLCATQCNECEKKVEELDKGEVSTVTDLEPKDDPEGSH